MENLRERVLERRPDVLFIEFAMNDAYLDYSTSTETCRTNLEYMIDRVVQSCPMCSFVLQTMNVCVNNPGTRPLHRHPASRSASVKLHSRPMDGRAQPGRRQPRSDRVVSSLQTAMGTTRSSVRSWPSTTRSTAPWPRSRRGGQIHASLAHSST